MANLKCSTCKSRYRCSEKKEYDCKKNDYRWHEEDDSVNIPCFECSRLDICFTNFESSKEYNEFCNECMTNGYNNFFRDVTEVTKEEDEEEDENTAHIKCVSREKRVGERICPKCGKVVSMGYISIQEIPYCSSCGKRLDDRFMNYCPNCGKKIRK